jgi:primosomal protein N' (replication factor Y)
MAGIVLSSPNVQEVFELGTRMARMDGPLRKVGAQVYGPALAPVARIRGRHRVRLLVKADKSAQLQKALLAWTAQFKFGGDLRMAIDIDPQNFY